MTRSALWLVLAVSLASSLTAAFLTWEYSCEPVPFEYIEGSISIATGERSPTLQNWERADGIVPYARYRGWGVSPGEVSRWELVRFDGARFGLAVLAAGLSWGLAGLALRGHLRLSSATAPVRTS